MSDLVERAAHYWNLFGKKIVVPFSLVAILSMPAMAQEKPTRIIPPAEKTIYLDGGFLDMNGLWNAAFNAPDFKYAKTPFNKSEHLPGMFFKASAKPIRNLEADLAYIRTDFDQKLGNPVDDVKLLRLRAEYGKDLSFGAIAEYNINSRKVTKDLFIGIRPVPEMRIHAGYGEGFNRVDNLNPLNLSKNYKEQFYINLSLRL